MTDTLPDISNPALGPADMLGDLVTIFTGAINGHERSQQKAIGPSEIGHPCARRIGYKLAGVQPVNDTGLPWKPTIGTAMHTWAQEVVERWNWAQPDFETAGPRFLLETRVDVGEMNGETVNGNCDIYDRLTSTVLDYKFVGGDQLRKYKANGPGDQYRVQAHTYGTGWVRRGYPVRHVAIWFLPRDREFNLSHLWTEDYDPLVAPKALDRVEGIAKLTESLGAQAMAVLPTAASWCGYCPHYLPASTDLPNACPGHPGDR
jgi:hypothetical protein